MRKANEHGCVILDNKKKLLAFFIIIICLATIVLASGLGQSNGASCASAKDILNFTLPAQEAKCKELGGQSAVFVVRNIDDYNSPVIVTMCLKNYWTGVVK